MYDTIRENLLRIQEEIAPCKPNIIAVTKYFDESAMAQCFDAGLRDFGESRAVEAVHKINNLSIDIREKSRFHFIGHLQTNKVKLVVANFDYIHSVDSLKLAKVISEEAQKIGKVQNVLVQINNADEEQKFGFSKAEIFDIMPEILELPSIHVAGVMNMAPIDATEEELDELFGEIYQIRNSLAEKFGCDLKEISMGMSRDYPVAVRHGATMLRIGRKLFK